MTSGLASLFRKDRKMLHNLWVLLSRDSLFKVGFILAFATAIVVGLFALFYDGFMFLAEFGGAGFMITRRLFSLFFLGLGIMLVISSIVSSYSSFFRSRDLAFLLTNPFDEGEISLYKFAESALLSSWAFIFIIVPFAGAYAVQQHITPLFWLWVIIFTIPFLILCSGLGTLIMLIVVRWVPRGRALGLLLLLVAGVAGYMYVMRLSHGAAFDNPVFMLSRLTPGLRLASNPLLPSWWTAEGLRALARGDWSRGLWLLGVLISNACMATLLVRAVGQALFFDTYQRLYSARGTAIKRLPWSRWLSRGSNFLPRDVHAMLLKDVRGFWRDPMQWSQALIFFGLLALYFASIRSFRYDQLPAEWRNMIAFLNVFSVAAVQCSLASRFVYPQLSLEGQAFWTLGLSPVTAGRILWTKFTLAAVAMLSISVALILLSTHMLQVEPLVRTVAVGLIACISLAVTGLSTGLGAVFLDLRQTNPAAIVSGFGGTVNLVLSLAFMLAAIIPFALIFHLSNLGHLTAGRLVPALWLAALWLLVLTPIASMTPLLLGQRAMSRRDY